MSGAVATKPKVAISEDFFSRRWLATHGEDYFFVAEAGRWRRFDESTGLWLDDNPGARASMRDTIAKTLAANFKGKLLLQASSRWLRWAVVCGALNFAGTTRTRGVSMFDADPYRIGLEPQGTPLIFDVQKCAARETARTDLLTKTTGVSPKDEPCARWLRFLNESLANYPPDEIPEIIEWMQRWLGYALTGDCREETFLFLQGPPLTGKSTFASVVEHIWGAYYRIVSGTRIVGYENAHRQWLARLAGARLCIINELPERGSWRLDDLNAIVSGESIEANYMRRDSFEFRSTAKVLILGNARPRASASAAIWRRMRLVEFSARPEKPDVHLKASLLAEAPAILNWILTGAKLWKKQGLGQAPKAICAGTETYRLENDLVSDFLEQTYDFNKDASILTSDVYKDFKDWCANEGISKPLTKTALGIQLKARPELTASRRTTGRFWEGMIRKSDGGL